MDVDSLWLRVKKDIDEKEKRCSVCLDDITGDQRLIVFECGHINHEGCDILLEQCPTCRHHVHGRFYVDTEQGRLIPLSTESVIDRLHGAIRAAENTAARAGALIKMLQSGPESRPRLQLNYLRIACVIGLCFIQLLIGIANISERAHPYVAVGSMLVSAAFVQLLGLVLWLTAPPGTYNSQQSWSSM